eukprot:sb/3469599/
MNSVVLRLTESTRASQLNTAETPARQPTPVAVEPGEQSRVPDQPRDIDTEVDVDQRNVNAVNGLSDSYASAISGSNGATADQQIGTAVTQRGEDSLAPAAPTAEQQTGSGVSQDGGQTTEPQATDPRLVSGAEGGPIVRQVRSARSSRPPAGRESYRHHYVLVIHDGLFEGFNKAAFPRHLRLKLIKVKSLKNLATTEREAFIRTVEKLNPECVFIHTGWNDAFLR